MDEGTRGFVGRELGCKMRVQFNLDAVDAEAGSTEITIPEDIVAVSTPFFLGLFGKSVRTLGRDGFRRKYSFVCNEAVKKGIYHAVERALKITDPLDV
jgi:hypothetical protein